MTMLTMSERAAKLRQQTGCVSGSSLKPPAERAQPPGYSGLAADTSKADTLGDAVQAVLQRPSINDVSLEERLVRKLGYGQCPAKRKGLYKRLARVHARHREAVEEMISCVWAEAQSARNKANYFCFSISRRLAESGLELGRGAGGHADAI
jgi:hypothetical protein